MVLKLPIRYVCIACVSLSKRVGYETLNKYGTKVAYQVCIACVSLSKRVGYETLNEYGTEVAYQVRTYNLCFTVKESWI